MIAVVKSSWGNTILPEIADWFGNNVHCGVNVVGNNLPKSPSFCNTEPDLPLLPFPWPREVLPLEVFQVVEVFVTPGSWLDGIKNYYQNHE